MLVYAEKNMERDWWQMSDLQVALQSWAAQSWEVQVATRENFPFQEMTYSGVTAIA